MCDYIQTSAALSLNIAHVRTLTFPSFRQSYLVVLDYCHAERYISSQDRAWQQEHILWPKYPSAFEIHKFINAIDLHKALRTTSGKAAPEH